MYTKALALAALAVSPALAQYSVNIYWGQKTGPDLATLCQSDGFEYLTLAFLNQSPEQDPSGLDYPGSNFAGNCGPAVYSKDGVDSNLQSQCTAISTGIAACHNAGKKVLLSIGGVFNAETSDYTVSSPEAGVDFANFLWAAYGPKTSGYTGARPFGDNVLDGFDFDIETKFADQSGYIALINQLNVLISAAGSSAVISGAPQCPLASEWFQMENIITSSKFDLLWIQFYNNPACDDVAGNSDGEAFNFNAWQSFIAGTDSAAAKLFVGLPGDDTSASAGSGYVQPGVAAQLMKDLKGQPSFGGAMVWDATTGSGNVLTNGRNYYENLHDALFNVVTPVPTVPEPVCVTYTVRSGDFCYDIGQTFGLTVAQLEGLNPGLDCNQDIFPGQVFKVGGTCPVTSSSSTTTTTTQSSTTTTTAVSTTTDTSTTTDVTTTTDLSTTTTSSTTTTTDISTSTTDSSTTTTDVSTTTTSSTTTTTDVSTTTESATTSTTASSSTSASTSTTDVASTTSASSTSSTASGSFTLPPYSNSTTTTGGSSSIVILPTFTDSSSTSTSASALPTVTGSSSTSNVLPTVTDSASLTTSTITATTVYTVTSCPATVPNCPLGHVTTETIIIGTTVCPVADVTATVVPATTTPPPAGGAWTTSTVYATTVYTITACLPSVPNCPAKGSITTEIIPLYTTVCPVGDVGATAAPGPYPTKPIGGGAGGIKEEGPAPTTTTKVTSVAYTFVTVPSKAATGGAIAPSSNGTSLVISYTVKTTGGAALPTGGAAASSTPTKAVTAGAGRNGVALGLSGLIAAVVLAL